MQPGSSVSAVTRLRVDKLMIRCRRLTERAYDGHMKCSLVASPPDAQRLLVIWPSLRLCQLPTVGLQQAASSPHRKAKPRGQLRNPTLPRDSLRLSAMRVSVLSQGRPPPHTHTPKRMRQKDGVSCHTGPIWLCLQTCLHFSQDVSTNCMQLTQYECSISCSSASGRSVGRSVCWIHCITATGCSTCILTPAHLNAVVTVQQCEGGEGGYRYAKPLYAGTGMLNRCTPVPNEQQRNRTIWPLTLLVTEPLPSNA